MRMVELARFRDMGFAGAYCIGWRFFFLAAFLFLGLALRGCWIDSGVLVALRGRRGV